MVWVIKIGLVCGFVVFIEGFVIGCIFVILCDYCVDGNKEMILFGFMNICGLFFFCYVIIGIFIIFVVYLLFYVF